MNGNFTVPANPSADDLGETYGRLVRHARWRRAGQQMLLFVFFYLPFAKQAVRFFSHAEATWGDAVLHTGLMAFVLGFVWSLPFGVPTEPSGYAALPSAGRKDVDAAILSGTPPQDPLMHRVCDARAALLMRQGSSLDARTVVIAVLVFIMMAAAREVWVVTDGLAVMGAVLWQWRRGRRYVRPAIAYLTTPREAAAPRTAGK